jgi:hypothetical protein
LFLSSVDYSSMESLPKCFHRQALSFSYLRRKKPKPLIYRCFGFFIERKTGLEPATLSLGS